MASDSDWYIEIASPICKVLKIKKGPGQDESVLLWINFS